MRSSRSQWRRAFASAWIAMQLSYELPGVQLEVRRGQVWQPGRPAGAPLYPVARIRWFRTTTAPTLSRSQSERAATARAMPIKYSSQVGRLTEAPSGMARRGWRLSTRRAARKTRWQLDQPVLLPRGIWEPTRHLLPSMRRPAPGIRLRSLVVPPFRHRLETVFYVALDERELIFPHPTALGYLRSGASEESVQELVFGYRLPERRRIFIEPAVRVPDHMPSQCRPHLGRKLDTQSLNLSYSHVPRTARTLQGPCRCRHPGNSSASAARFPARPTPLL